MQSLSRMYSTIKERVLGPEKPISPTQRWEKKSHSCPRDLSIKRFGVDALFNGSVATLSGSLMAPFIATNFLTGGAFTVAALGVLGVWASVKGLYKSYDLDKKLDWTDYSNKSKVEEDIISITSTKLKVLIAKSDSPAYRVGNLKKYGVLGKENASRMQSIVDRYIQNQENINDLAYRQPLVTKLINSNDARVKKIIGAFQNAVLEHKDIKAEWADFQRTVKSDLPNIDLAGPQYI